MVRLSSLSRKLKREIMIARISIQMHSQKFNFLMQIMIISSWSTRSSSKNKVSHTESLALKKRRKEKVVKMVVKVMEEKVRTVYPSLQKKRKRSFQDTSWSTKWLRSQEFTSIKYQGLVLILLLSLNMSHAFQKKLSMQQSLTSRKLKLNELSKIRRGENSKMLRRRRGKSSKRPKRTLGKNLHQKKDLGQKSATNHSRQRRSSM